MYHPQARTQGGQSKVSLEASAGDRSGPPAELRPSLESRLSLFISAQAEGDWDTVASMLGKYWGAHHNSRAENTLLTPAQKSCVTSQLKKFPILSFAVKKYSFSTEILSMPVSRRWWLLDGDVVIGSDSGERHRNILLGAYRDGGEWYFTPPSYDLSWDDLSEPAPTRDHSNEIRVVNDKADPLQIVEVHAFLVNEISSPISPTPLNVIVKLKNRAGKPITAFRVRLFGEGDGTEFSGRINPGGVVQKELRTYRSVAFCKAGKRDLHVEAVKFADGTHWELPAECSFCSDPILR